MRAVLESILDVLFGQYRRFVQHFVQSTLAFLVVLAGLYIVKTTVVWLFPDGHLLDRIMHIVDSMAALLALGGFVLWTALDLYFMLSELARRRGGEGTS